MCRDHPDDSRTCSRLCHRNRPHQSQGPWVWRACNTFAPSYSQHNVLAVIHVPLRPPVGHLFNPSPQAIIPIAAGHDGPWDTLPRILHCVSRFFRIIGVLGIVPVGSFDEVSIVVVLSQSWNQPSADSPTSRQHHRWCDSRQGHRRRLADQKQRRMASGQSIQRIVAERLCSSSIWSNSCDSLRRCKDTPPC